MPLLASSNDDVLKCYENSQESFRLLIYRLCEGGTIIKDQGLLDRSLPAVPLLVSWNDEVFKCHGLSQEISLVRKLSQDLDRVRRRSQEMMDWNDRQCGVDEYE